MRLLVAAALVLGAAPALAQDLPEDYDVFEVDTLDAPLRFEIERDEDGAVIFRRGDGEDEVFRFQLPDPEMLGRFGEDMEALRHRFLFREHLDDGDGPAALFLRGLSGEPGVSPETRERMRQLEREARAAARRARQLGGAEREEADERLDAVLGELFEVRGEARRERAAHLRERAAELEAEAAELEDALRDREARREALIDARRADLLGETDDDW
jgi:hypothetical protein